MSSSTSVVLKPDKRRVVYSHITCKFCGSNQIVSRGTSWKCLNCKRCFSKNLLPIKYCKNCNILIAPNNRSGLCERCYRNQWRKINVENSVTRVATIICPHCGKRGHLEKCIARNKFTGNIHHIRYQITHSIYSPSKYRTKRKQGLTWKQARSISHKSIHCPYLKPNEVKSILGYLP